MIRDASISSGWPSSSAREKHILDSRDVSRVDSAPVFIRFAVIIGYRHILLFYLKSRSCVGKGQRRILKFVLV